MQTVKKAGEKFVHLGKVLTAKSFFGKTGIEYPTAEEAIIANGTTAICVKNEEYGGASPIELSFSTI